MRITTIAAFVQSIRNQFIVYDCKNKLCTCQPILLIFSENNLWKQFFLPKRRYSTLWNIQNWHKLSKFHTSPPPNFSQRIYTDLKNDPDNGEKSRNLWKTFIPDSASSLKQSLRVDNMSLHSDTLSWFRDNQSLLLHLNAACLEEKQQKPTL